MFHVIANANSIVQLTVQIKNGKCQYECKKYGIWKKAYSWNPSTFVYENSKHSKHIIVDLVIACDKVIYVMIIL